MAGDFRARGRWATKERKNWIGRKRPDKTEEQELEQFELDIEKALEEAVNDDQPEYLRELLREGEPEKKGRIDELLEEMKGTRTCVFCFEQTDGGEKALEEHQKRCAFRLSGLSFCTKCSRYDHETKDCKEYQERAPWAPLKLPKLKAFKKQREDKKEKRFRKGNGGSGVCLCGTRLRGRKEYCATCTKRRKDWFSQVF